MPDAVTLMLGLFLKAKICPWSWPLSPWPTASSSSFIRCGLALCPGPCISKRVTCSCL